MANVTISTRGFLSKEEILEFQSLVKKFLHKDLSYSEAEDQATRLIMLFELILHQPIDYNEK